MDIDKLFRQRAPKDIACLNSFLDNNRLILFFTAKKLAGKSVYSKYLAHSTKDLFVHVSIGDLVRKARDILQKAKGKEKLLRILEGRRLGTLQFDDIVDFIVDHSNKRLLPVELILALLEVEIDNLRGKSIVIDGFPRTVSQVEQVQQLVEGFGRQGARVLFVNIKCPEDVLNLRLKGRRVCPVCQASRNIEVLLTKEVGYDPESKEFFLVCDNPKCDNVRMVRKSGDEEGVESMVERNVLTGKLMEEIRTRFKGQVVEVDNAVKLQDIKKHEKCDFTEMTFLKWNEKSREVQQKRSPMVVLADDGKTKVLSRYAEPVVVELVKAIVKILKLKKMYD